MRGIGASIVWSRLLYHHAVRGVGKRMHADATDLHGFRSVQIRHDPCESVCYHNRRTESPTLDLSLSHMPKRTDAKLGRHLL